MIPRIGRQLSLGQFKNSVSFVQQAEFGLNLLENYNTIIPNGPFCCRSGLLDAHMNLRTGRMIERVIEHLRKTVVPDIHYVVGHLAQYSLHIVSPYHVLAEDLAVTKVRDRVGLLPLD